MRFPVALSVALLCGCVPLLSQSPAKDSPLPAARDSHEGLLIAAQPIVNAEEYKTRFGKKNPYDTGIIAIDAYFRNDEDVPVEVDLTEVRLTVELPGQPLEDLASLDAKTVAAEVFAGKPKDPMQRRRFPIPNIGTSNPSKEFFELQNKLQAAMLRSDLIPGRGTVHGLFFFDVDGNFSWVSMSKFYVPNLKRVPTGKALLYFEIPFSSTSAPAGD